MKKVIEAAKSLQRHAGISVRNYRKMLPTYTANESNKSINKGDRSNLSMLEGLSFDVSQTLDKEMQKQYANRALAEKIISNQICYWCQELRRLFNKTIVSVVSE